MKKRPDSLRTHGHISTSTFSAHGHFPRTGHVGQGGRPFGRQRGGLMDGAVATLFLLDPFFAMPTPYTPLPRPVNTFYAPSSKNT